MAIAMLGWNNLVVSGALSAGSAALPVSNLQSPIGSPSLGWQTVSGILTYGAGAYFTVDAGTTSATWRAFVLARTNLTAAAVLFMQGGNDPTFGTVIYSTGALSASVAPGFGQLIYVAPSDWTCRYVRFLLSDSSNPDGFINVPLAYAGPVWQPASNISPGTTQGRDDQTLEIVTRGGQEYPLTYWTRRRWELDFQGVRSSEVWPYLDDLDAKARLGGNVLLIPNPASATINRETVFGRLKPKADISYFQGAQDRRAWKATVTERL